MILLIDNYDSFTYNFYHLLAQNYEHITVCRNDQISLDEIKCINPKAIVLSPGPKTPKEAGICLEVLCALKGKYPILGICLGHQALYEAFGGKVLQAPYCSHGKSCEIIHNNKGIFKGLKNPFKGARYHSLVADPYTLPSELAVEAWTRDHLIMAIKHKRYNMWGVQFHPESFLSECAEQLIQNWLKTL